ncbi:MAG: hypothetical protein U1F76_05545 [Candidatus Competibacteraceae bacterium]
MNSENQKNFLKSEILNLVKGLVVASIFFIVFVLILIVKRKIYPSPIIYFEGILIIVFMTILAIGFSFLIGAVTAKSKAFSSYIILGVLLGAVGSYAFHITLPTTLDRSISVFMLSLLRSKDLNVPEIQCNFVKQFVIDSKGIDRRVKEQLVTGNIIENNERFHITDRGKGLVSLWIQLVDIFSVRKDFSDVKPSNVECNFSSSNDSPVMAIPSEGQPFKGDSK